MKIKKFRSGNGIEIWVGMDDYSNDRLSIKVAHANDWWFHVSGMPGSHVLLRCGEEKLDAQKSDLQEAAALAAWFSKMRQGGKVAVNYCLAQYVKKPRGAKPGTVTIAREKKITVRPALRDELPTD